jgi:two-component system phosphate regulon sensor histidine kinase PhoR
VQRVRKLNVFYSRYFWKLFLTFAALLLGITLVTGWQAYDHFQHSLYNNIKSTLRHKLSLLEPLTRERLLRPRNTVEFQEVMTRLGNETETRITVLNPAGEVLADSAVDPSFQPNHANRAEIAEARVHGIGYSQRLSETVNQPFLYMARALYDHDRLIGFVRVASQEAQLSHELQTHRFNILISALGGLAVALLLALLFARRVTVPITEMVHVCNAMRRGDYEKRVKAIASDEIGRLGDTLNRLGSEITGKIAQISLERAQLKTMLAGMVEGIIAIDNDQRIRFCNRAAYNLLKSDANDVRGMRLVEAPGFDVLTGIAVQAQKKRELVEEELDMEAGANRRRLEVHASFFEGTDTNGVIILLHDVTKVRNLERVRRDFVANVSHEIKTPLTSIKGYVETLLSNQENDPEIINRFLQKIDRNADRLMQLVRDILSLAKIESEEDQKVSYKAIDWSALANQVVAQYEDNVLKKGLTVEMREDVKPLLVMGDREALFQVVDNLVTNAIRYTPQGGRISIHLKQDKQFGTVEVTDTGIGIPKKYLARIFERFYRVDKARSRELGGTGLGLSIVKHLVSTMGGKISVESEVGLGSTFRVSLPLAR